jgi:hypothetical protein
METNKREGRTINEKYTIIKFFEYLVKKNTKNAKSKTVEEFKFSWF